MQFMIKQVKKEEGALIRSCKYLAEKNTEDETVDAVIKFKIIIKQCIMGQGYYDI